MLDKINEQMKREYIKIIITNMHLPPTTGLNVDGSGVGRKR